MSDDDGDGDNNDALGSRLVFWATTKRRPRPCINSCSDSAGRRSESREAASEIIRSLFVANDVCVTASVDTETQSHTQSHTNVPQS